jgi:hypothetical protein
MKIYDAYLDKTTDLFTASEMMRAKREQIAVSFACAMLSNPNVEESKVTKAAFFMAGELIELLIGSPVKTTEGK